MKEMKEMKDEGKKKNNNKKKIGKIFNRVKTIENDQKELVSFLCCS